MIIITGSVRAKADTFEALQAECVAHSVRSRDEPGCVDHRVHIDCEDPLRLVFVEYWSDMDAVKAHFAVPESGGFVEFLREHAAEPPQMTIYSADRVGP